MYCPKCAATNPDEGRYCRKCGTDLGTVSDALSGKLEIVDQEKKGSGFLTSPSWEGSMVKLFLGVAFLLVAFLVGIDTLTGRVNLWFWFVLPAFVLMGIGIGEMVRLSVKTDGDSVADKVTSEKGIDTKEKASLPPSKTEYVSPEEDSTYHTEDLVPASVVEHTTRRLEMDPEGETMNLPDNEDE